jgi:CheY-like chemotaxis protein
MGMDRDYDIFQKYPEDSLLWRCFVHGLENAKEIVSQVDASASENSDARKKESNRLRILLVDDHPLLRKILRRTLERHPRFEVIGEAEDGVQAIAQSEVLKPDVVLLDLSMPGMGGLDAARHIQKTVPQAAIVILSVHTEQSYVDQAKMLGIRAYVPKIKSEALFDAIDAAVRGETFYIVSP